jgi:threonine aldolase
MSTPSANHAFASDNTAGICPEALNAIQVANTGRVPSYGEDGYRLMCSWDTQDSDVAAFLADAREANAV